MIQNNLTDIKIPASAAILIGGKSSRFGSDKVYMKLDTESISEYLFNKFREIFSEVFFISNETKKIAEDQTLYTDIIADKGPLGGLYTSLKKSANPYCFVAACDTPFISGELIKLLWDSCNKYEAVVPVWQGKSEPLASFYHKRCTDKIEELIENDNISLKNFLEQVKTRKVNLSGVYSEIELRKLFFNINTQESLEEAKKIWKILHL
jgi:molybdopterin-guanine dinucleotide biosynthesis protein A